jgi:hypothetical protein
VLLPMSCPASMVPRSVVDEFFDKEKGQKGSGYKKKHADVADSPWKPTII